MLQIKKKNERTRVEKVDNLLGDTLCDYGSYTKELVFKGKYKFLP